MTYQRILYGIVLSGSLMLLMAGCGKKEEPAAPTPSAPEQPQAAPAAPAPEPAPAPSVTPAPATPAVPAPATEPAPAAAGAAGAAAQANVAEAQTMMSQVTQYISQNKYDLADTTLTKLEKMKADLPASLQGQITNARAMLDAAKASGGANLPALPGGVNK